MEYDYGRSGGQGSGAVGPLYHGRAGSIVFSALLLHCFDGESDVGHSFSKQAVDFLLH